MEWQAVVLVMQILMLAVGWFLFQQAKGELSAQAAETPVLGEVKALQRSVKQLLADLQQTSERASAQLEAQCRQAREMASTLEEHLETLEEARRHSLVTANEPPSMLSPLTLVTEQSAIAVLDTQQAAVVTAQDMPFIAQSLPAPPNSWEQKRAYVFALSDAGQSAGDIARETGISEGEIETLLGLRCQHAAKGRK